MDIRNSFSADTIRDLGMFGHTDIPILSLSFLPWLVVEAIFNL